MLCPKCFAISDEGDQFCSKCGSPLGKPTYELVPLQPKVRFAVLNRDGFSCRYCGRSAPDVDLHVDHVIPVARGGTNDLDNLVTACADCNLGKGVTVPDIEAVDTDSLLIEEFHTMIRRFVDEQSDAAFPFPSVKVSENEKPRRRRFGFWR